MFMYVFEAIENIKFLVIVKKEGPTIKSGLVKRDQVKNILYKYVFMCSQMYLKT